MHTLIIVMILVLCASPARADLYTNAFLSAETVSINLADDDSTASVSLAITNTTASPYSIVFLSAGLTDNRGHFFQLATRPTNIAVGRRSTCDEGVILAPGARLDIGFSFRVSRRALLDTPTLNFLGEFQAQRHTCENFTVSLRNLGVVAR